MTPERLWGITTGGYKKSPATQAKPIFTVWTRSDHPKLNQVLRRDTKDFLTNPELSQGILGYRIMRVVRLNGRLKKVQGA